MGDIKYASALPRDPTLQLFEAVKALLLRMRIFSVCDKRTIASFQYYLHFRCYYISITNITIHNVALKFETGRSPMMYYGDPRRTMLVGIMLYDYRSRRTVAETLS
jgi:hypothetical protein